MSDDPKLTERPETSMAARPERAGVAPIKPEYLINQTPIVDAASSSALNDFNAHSTADADADDLAEGVTSTSNGDRGGKRRKTEGKGKKDRGQNKARTFAVIRESGPKICRQWELSGGCPRGAGCKFQHSWEGYFVTKPADLYFPRGDLRGEPPYLDDHNARLAGEDEVGRTIDLDTTCPVKEDLGYCPYGWRCRYLGGHVQRIPLATEADEEEMNGGQAGSSRDVIGGWQVTALPTEEQKEGTGGWKQDETNWPDFELIQKLRGNKYHFTFSEKYLAHTEPQKHFNLARSRPPKRPNPESDEVLSKDGVPPAAVEGMSEEEAAMGAMLAEPSSVSVQNGAEHSNGEEGVVNGESEAMDVPLRPEEKKRLHWDDGLYLAPLTTVGNLPFRRLCTSYGATITISEMALAAPLVAGNTDEYALLRRHKSEKMYGVQLAGGFANRMVPAAELIGREFAGGGVDFVDINLGCPIDLVFNQGAGSALLDSPGRLGKILVGMNRALGDIPLTVKFRTGVASGKPNAHKLIPRFATEWGSSAMTLHGRSRQQRYSKLADWAYIKQCSQTLRDTLSDAGLPKIPIFGNGDCFSAQSYYDEKEKSGVDGVMIARGALIKPWIFTEIAERREWDITAVERLEGIRQFAEFGLSHWGSDTQGISITRRFLCEFLSFTHRYIPIGLLERMPPMLNERPPAYRGRNELETLLASPFVGDWVKISEMFLGKAEEQWSFTPKHKSNAYGGEEAQG